MDLQTYLIEKFQNYQPPAPGVIARTRRNVNLDCSQVEPFAFLGDQLLYKVEKNNNIPKWIVVYSGGKAVNTIDNLEPRYPHRFRMKIILKSTAVSQLSKLALQHYGDEHAIYEIMENVKKVVQKSNVHNVETKKPQIQEENNVSKDCGDVKIQVDDHNGDQLEEQGPRMGMKNVVKAVKLVSGLKKIVEDFGDIHIQPSAPRWLESQWSGETWTSTEPDGTTPGCFCMAVQCGYLKQVQSMLDERADLLNAVNPSNGLTPLATAVRKGDINTVRFLLTLGADIDQPSLAGQTPLHLSVLAADVPIVELLLEKGADVQARDWNGLRMEHYAADSCSLEMLQYIMDNGGNVQVKDYNGWTPLFRALCQGAKVAIIQELVARGSNVNDVDCAGLPLSSVARLLKDRHGRSRNSIMSLVDSHYPHQKALANFTRLTKKIYNVQSLLRMN